jgi:fatty acid desaturase
LKHHAWAGNLEHDPVMGIAKLVEKGKLNNVIVDFVWKSWFPAFALLQLALFWKLSFQQLFFCKTIKSFFVALVSISIPWLFWCSLSTIFADIWWRFGLAFIFYLMLIEVVNFPHHLNIKIIRSETKTPLYQQYEVSRSCIYPKWFAFFVCLNFNYHSAHHLFPRIPWHYLPEADSIMRSEFQNVPTCSGISWIINNKKKKLINVVRGETDRCKA